MEEITSINGKWDRIRKEGVYQLSASKVTKTLKLKYEWLRKLLPEGFPYPSSTLISGLGGTGKPLVGFAFISAWLGSGGSVIGIPLQYPTAEFLRTAMDKLYNVNLKDYYGRIAYIRFNPTIDKWRKIEEDTLEANLLKPKVWDEALEKASKMLEKGGIGTLIFGSALNLLLFSPTYKDDIFKKLKDIIEGDKDKTYIFSVSTSAFEEEIKIWEEAAENLAFTRMEKPMRLFLRIHKMKGVEFSREEVEVPIPRNILNEIKTVAETTRKRIIPVITKI